MKELGISINKILKDWLQSNGEGDIVFTDDIAINEVTDEIVTECRAKYDELLQQRDELKEVLKRGQKTIKMCDDYITKNAYDLPEMLREILGRLTDIDIAIKNTER